MRRLAIIALMLMAVTLPTGPALGRAQSPSLSTPRLQASVEIESAQRLRHRFLLGFAQRFFESLRQRVALVLFVFEGLREERIAEVTLPGLI